MIWSAHHLFNRLFEKLRYRYLGLLDWSLAHRGRVLAAFMGLSLASFGLATVIGEDFFPAVDAGQMRLHARGPAGCESNRRNFGLPRSNAKSGPSFLPISST